MKTTNPAPRAAIHRTVRIMSEAGNLLTHYRDLLTLCDALELVADDLPRPPAAGHCRRLAASLAATLAATHREEEQVLLPLLALAGRPALGQLASRLRREHDADSLAASEIGEALMALAEGGSILSADATGYMLRSFFESVRRHVHAEQDMIALLRPAGDGI